MKKISQLIAKNRVLILIIAIILLIPSAIGYFNTKEDIDKLYEALVEISNEA